MPPLPNNLIDLVDSKIVQVSLYSGRAEVTRRCRFPARVGQNYVNIAGLPNLMDKESLRVEARDAASIHDVALSVMPKVDTISTSVELDKLLDERDLVGKALERCRKGSSSLENYLSTINVVHTDVKDLGEVLLRCDQAAESLDKKTLKLEKEMKEFDKKIENERKELSRPRQRDMLGLQAAITVAAKVEGEAEIALIYVVEGAAWKALYDIRVDTETKNSKAAVKLIYKATITQKTGEAWNGVSLSLQTISPTFDVVIPGLPRWNISVDRSELRKMTKRGGPSVGGLEGSPSVQELRSTRLGRMAERARPEGGNSSDPKSRSPSRSRLYRDLYVTPQCGINAHFLVPEKITIPSDGAAHNITIMERELDATMSWTVLPKLEAKPRLIAKIKNTSEQILLPGPANVYVDGSFTFQSNVPLSIPQENFECFLGLDSSVLVVYHPCTKKVSSTGSYYSVHVFSQRITIQNTRSIPLIDLKVIDQVPVSNHSQVAVKLISPPLALPEHVTTISGEGNERKPPSPTRVSESVSAQWKGSDDPRCDLDSLGKDGQLNWVCTVASHGEIDLLLSWEVATPV